jgi:hypothetical protein
MNFGGYSREKCGVGSEVQGSGLRGSRFRVPFFALRATQGKQGSAQPPAKKTAGQIEKETQKKRISNIE